MKTFWLGTHMPEWLAKTRVPLFISRVRLARRSKWKPALGRWALDSGGFSELSLKGTWTVSPGQYVSEVRRWRDEIGNMKWAAIQDWMCEPWILEKTGLTVAEHQARTVQSYETLQDLAPEIPWTPVIQGFTRDDYMRCWNLYESRGHNLRALKIVGLGSVCRRQSTDEAESIVSELASNGLRLHGFGFKTLGLRKVFRELESADSMAWSFNARKNPPLPGCTHPRCGNCMKYALAWRERLLKSLPGWTETEDSYSMIMRYCA